MSEYQYYEFQAVDRPLTAKEMSELRSFSTRARISPTSFVNDYSWGNFRGNADAWMEKYFDVFLYVANWGTRVLKLRLPARLLDLKDARRYCMGERVSAREKDRFRFVPIDRNWVEGDGLLSSMIPVRAELVRGYRRALYLGWLLCVQNGDLEEDDAEPPVPPGLGELSASLESMVKFLRIDADLLHVAARTSAALGAAGPNHEDVLAWLATLPAAEKDAMLARLVTADDQGLVPAELLRRFQEEGGLRGQERAEPQDARTAGDLLRAAEARAQQREQLAARNAAQEKERGDREAAAARATRLDSLAGKEPELWSEIESLISTKQPKSYDAAATLLVDLRDLAASKTGGDFQPRLEALRARHARKPSLLDRLRKAGL
jgi:hypothetical protein